MLVWEMNKLVIIEYNIRMWMSESINNNFIKSFFYKQHIVTHNHKYIKLSCLFDVSIYCVYFIFRFTENIFKSVISIHFLFHIHIVHCYIIFVKCCKYKVIFVELINKY